LNFSRRDPWKEKSFSLMAKRIVPMCLNNRQPQLWSTQDNRLRDASRVGHVFDFLTAYDGFQPAEKHVDESVCRRK
jgi:hypothetical protein